MPKAKLPPSIQSVIRYTVDHLRPERVVLFGSRARGDNEETSDFDIAVFLSKENEAFFNWARFVEEVRAKPLTLFKIDWVLASSSEECSESLRNKINSEGINLYERNP